MRRPNGAGAAMSKEDMQLTSTRPYLLRAFFDWIVDNGLTPYILVDARSAGLDVAGRHVVDGKLVLNIGPSAVRELVLGNDAVRFHARFGGVARALDIPVRYVLAIYAKENGRGVVFTDEAGAGGGAGDGPTRGRPDLKLVT